MQAARAAEAAEKVKRGHLPKYGAANDVTAAADKCGKEDQEPDLFLALQPKMKAPKKVFFWKERHKNPQQKCLEKPQKTIS